MDDGYCAASLVVRQFYTSEQRRGVGEADGLGEKAADFDFRIDAWLKPAKQLDDVGRVNQRGGVRLLGLDCTNVLNGRRVLRKSRC